MPYPIERFINKVINHDCRTVLPHLPESSVQCVITDPPYLVNFKTRNGAQAFQNDNPNDTRWLRPAYTEIYRVMEPDSFLVSFYGFFHAEKFLTVWKEVGFRPLELFVWPKQYASSERFVGRFHEQAYLLAKGNPRKPRVRLPSVIEEWHALPDRRLHPTQKPVAAILPLILALSDPGDIVLDPFAGSATTAVAARLCNRRYIMIESNPTYFKIAAARLNGGRATALR